jgi:uncharacterized protein
VKLLSGPEEFLAVIAAVLIPLGFWLALGQPAPRSDHDHRPLIFVLALAVGTVGGIYGIGGGSILAPMLVGLGFAVGEVAPAALASTFLTSIAGVSAFAILSIDAGGDIAPEWLTGIGLGIGGLAGSYVGASVGRKLPEPFLRRGLGVLALALGARYAVLALT